MEQKSPNTTNLLIIVGAILLVVAMVCGVVIWMAQRTFELNEKLLDARLEENRRPATVAPAVVAQPQPQPAAQPVVQPAPAPAPKVEQPQAQPKAKPQPAPEKKQPEVKPAEPSAPAAKPQPKAEAKPEKPASAKPTAPAKRKAPTETEAAKQQVGPDGLPINRVTLPVGNDELEWQL